MAVLTLQDQVAASLTRYSMLSTGDSVGVAVSGGADSVTLLHMLHALGGYRITVLHVNHHLRGAESDGDQAFVRELARRLCLPIEVQHAPVEDGNVEQVARDARRAFFADTRDRLNLRRVALGHNKSDQAETVLYRFLRGSGTAGLAGMSPVTHDGMIRPLLDLTREEIRQWAAAEGITWREDASNQNLEFVRNRLRLEVFNPQLVRVLAATAGVARDEEAWWTERITALFGSLATETRLGIQLPVSDLHALHAAEQRRMLRFAIRLVKGNLRSVDILHVESIRKLLASDAGHDRVLIPGVDALRSFGTLLLAEPGKLGAEVRHYRVDVKIGTELALPHAGGRLYVSRVKPDERFCGNFGVEAHFVRECSDLDGETLSRNGPPDSLYLRNWEPGDEYRRSGHEKSEKIKSLFQEYRVLLWERRRWPVLIVGDKFTGEKIVWSRRFGAAAEFQASDDCRHIVRLLYSAGDGFDTG